MHFERDRQCQTHPIQLSAWSTHKPGRLTETKPKKEYCALCQSPKPQENMQKCQECYPIGPPGPPGPPTNQAATPTPKKEYGALCTLRGVEGNAMDPKPQENVQKCQEFYHFRGRAAHSALFQHAIKLQDFD